MQLLFHLFVLSRILPLSFANDYFLHRHLLSRQSLDCLPVFLEYPSEPDIQCGGESSYVMPGCACCPGGTLGCYTATDVCSADAFGNPICCPEDEPDCSEEGDGAATTAPPSPTTAYDYPGLAVTSTQPDPVSTPASSQKAPPSSSTTASDHPGSNQASSPKAPTLSSTTASDHPSSAVATVSHKGASTSRSVELKSLVMFILLGLI